MNPCQQALLIDENYASINTTPQVIVDLNTCWQLELEQKITTNKGSAKAGVLILFEIKAGFPLLRVWNRLDRILTQACVEVYLDKNHFESFQIRETRLDNTILFVDN